MAGWADTPGARALPLMHALLSRWMRTPAQGADTTLWAATSERAAREQASGAFLFDRAATPTELLPPWAMEAGAAEDGSPERLAAVGAELAERVLDPLLAELGAGGAAAADR
jgi:hypothetical protein